MATYNSKAVGHSHHSQGSANSGSFSTEIQTSASPPRGSASQRYSQYLANKAQAAHIIAGVTRMQGEIFEEKLEAQRGLFSQIMADAQASFGNALNQLVSLVQTPAAPVVPPPLVPVDDPIVTVITEPEDPGYTKPYSGRETPLRGSTPPPVMAKDNVYSQNKTGTGTGSVNLNPIQRVVAGVARVVNNVGQAIGNGIRNLLGR